MTEKTPTVTELIAEGLDDGGFRAEHALAVAMADASPELLSACKAAVVFLKALPASKDRDALIRQLEDAADSASTPASRSAS